MLMIKLYLLILLISKTLLGSSILSNLENLNNQNIEELKKGKWTEKSWWGTKSKQNIISKEEFDKEINILGKLQIIEKSKIKW